MVICRFFGADPGGLGGVLAPGLGEGLLRVAGPGLRRREVLAHLLGGPVGLGGELVGLAGATRGGCCLRLPGGRAQAGSGRQLIAVVHDWAGVWPRVRVRLTPAGRAAARAGRGETAPVKPPHGLMSEWGWSTEWHARITGLGREHYERHHACYAELYPGIDAQPPPGPPPGAHAGLADHRGRRPAGLVPRRNGGSWPSSPRWSSPARASCATSSPRNTSAPGCPFPRPSPACPAGCCPGRSRK